MSVKVGVLLAVVMAVAVAIEFGVVIDPYETQCFYEQLPAKAKYNVEISAEGQSRYQFSIRTTGQNAQEIYTKSSTGDYQVIRLSKYAPQLNYYSFCTRNLRQLAVKISFKLQTGLQLMQLEILPDKTDNEYLDREVSFLQQQHNELFSSLEKIESAREATNTMLNLMSTKIIGFGVVGFVVIIAVNYLFYREVKRTLHQRKMI